VFVYPVLALAVRATILRVTAAIIWRRGLRARHNQVEIARWSALTSTNLHRRILGFGTVDIETRGNDRLVANMIANARGFAVWCWTSSIGWRRGRLTVSCWVFDAVRLQVFWHCRQLSITRLASASFSSSVFLLSLIIAENHLSGTVSPSAVGNVSTSH